MKKFTFLMIALFIAAMGFAQTKNLADVKHLPAGMHSQSTHRTYNYAQRQTRDNDQALVVLSVGDVWGDGTGYQLLIDADNEGWSSSSGPDCSSTYTQWEYMIPANASADCPGHRSTDSRCPVPSSMPAATDRSRGRNVGLHLDDPRRWRGPPTGSCRRPGRRCRDWWPRTPKAYRSRYRRWDSCTRCRPGPAPRGSSGTAGRTWPRRTRC